MSFGIGISDIHLCGRPAHTIYDYIKDSPGHCSDFATDLEYFSSLIVRTAVYLDRHTESSGAHKNCCPSFSFGLLEILVVSST